MKPLVQLIPSRDQVQGLLAVAELSHVKELADTMTQQDRDQCAAAGLEPYQAILSMLWPAMNKFTFLAGGRVAAMFGTLVPTRSHIAAVAGTRTPSGELWCFTGEYVAGAPFAFCSKFKFAVNELLGHFECLHARIAVEHAQMIALAKYVGGELAGPTPWGPNRRLFWDYNVRGAARG